ncbi:MAG: nucleoside-diphosphate kinase [Candidatus Peregrinibacteria bacterium Gr01-1014_25]|nr:MAG: nucleoside-diphosphate kinase [Candidatus Peregrinibacteria bacterium Gr01-1014_25]
MPPAIAASGEIDGTKPPVLRTLPATFLPTMERTLILLKPDCIAKGLCGAVMSRFESAGFKIRGCKMLHLGKDLLRDHYAHIADKPFYPDVESFMGSTPVIALVLEGANSVAAVRDMLGPTDSRKAPKGTIRGDLGVDMMVNIAHASDSPETAQKEVARFFSDEELFPY